MRYVALLRGINVGGKNKVAMSELKLCFGELGFTNISTYINSGNIFFETDETDIVRLVAQCEMAIEHRFGFAVVLTVVSVSELRKAMSHAPEWWMNGDRKTIRNDAIFVIPPTTAKEVLQELKMKSDSPDRFAHHGNVIFWSLPMESYNKSIVPKIIGTPIYKHITIRSSTTTKKLLTIGGKNE
jgi:uncharacterized protein (DUF1697 family)